MRHLIPLTVISLSSLSAAHAQSTTYPQNALCVDGSDAVCSQIPGDLYELYDIEGYFPNSNPPSGTGKSDGKFTVSQINFDYFAWQSFIGLNWPADSSGNPSTDTIGSDPSAPRVWESYMIPSEVYPQNTVQTTCPSGDRLTLTEASKLTSSSFIEPFTSWPLIDVAGNYVMYDVRVNPAEVAYINANNLSTAAGQATFKKDGGIWAFTPGTNGTPGAIEIKTSWRIFENASDAEGFATVPATVVVPAENTVGGTEPMCLDVTAGLVGMHIMQKISSPSTFSEFWVWGTFEHVDNAPLSTTASVSQSNNKATVSGNDPVSSCTAPTSVNQSYSFFDPDCTNSGSACVANAPPTEPSGGDYIWQSSAPYASDYLWDGKFGTQVARCWDIYETANTVTSQFQGALAGTVWANYQLVGAQWAAASNSEFPDPLMPFPSPVYLTNTTLETYLQVEPVLDKNGKTQTNGASGSCIICHNQATDSQKNPSNFSFLAGMAQ